MVKEIFQEMVSSKTKSTSRRRYKVLFVAVAIVISLALCAGAVAGDCPHIDENWDAFTYTSGNVPTGNYYLNDDVILAGDLTINSEVQLCLNGYKIDQSKHHICIGSGGNFSLYDCGNTVYTFKDDGSGRWIEAPTGVSLTGGVITNGNTGGGNDDFANGGGVLVRDGGSFYMYGGNIVGNTANNGGGGVCVFHGTGKFIMLGGNITGNKASGTGGGLETSSKVIIYGGNITHNTANGNGGGGVCVWNKGGYGPYTGNLTIVGGKISNNTVKGATKMGGGVYFTSNSKVTMYGGEISYNTLSGKGGGVYVDNSASFVMNDGNISGNSITGNNNGGGVYVASSASFVMNDGNISGNSAIEGSGGGVFIVDGTFTFEDGIIENNLAKNGGGGVETEGTFIMNGGDIVNNKAGIDTDWKKNGDGGGVCAWEGTFVMNAGNITQNTANNRGGGVYVAESVSEFTMNGGKISDNIGKNINDNGYGGGVSIYNNARFNLKGGIITSNSAKGSGDGVYIDTGSIYVSGNPVVKSNGYGGNKNNIYLKADQKISISEHLSAGAELHVNTPTNPLTDAVHIANDASASDVQYFFSDYGNNVIAELRNTNQIWLKEKPADPIDNFDNTTEHHNHPYGDTEQWHIWTGAHVVDPSVGGYYLLTEDAVLHGDWDVQGNTYLCLNGSVLDLQEHHITVSSGASLVICDCNSEVPHYFNAGSNPWVLSKSPTSNVVMGGVITNGEADNNGGGIFVDGGILTLDKGNIVGNKATTSGGGVFVATGTFTMNDGNIIGNKANSGGGGVENDATFIMTGGNISNNIVRDGGGVALWHNSVDTTFTMTGGNITNNTGTGEGGGVFVGNVGSEFKITRGNITGNVAKNGGGVYFKYGAMTISGSIVIKDNTLSGSGDDSNLYLYDKWRVATIEDTLNSDSEIWVKHPDTEQVNIASGASSGEENYFRSDDPVRSIDFNGGYIQLGPAISPSDKFPKIDHPHSEFPDAEWHEWNHTITEGPAIHHFDYYVLTDDITLTTDWVVPTGNTHLCLNGSVINLNGNNRKIIVNAGCNLTICDCKFGDPNHNHYFNKTTINIKAAHDGLTEGTDYHFWEWTGDDGTITNNIIAGGVITGGIEERSNQNAGVIKIEAGGNLTMLGGSIVGNRINQTDESYGAGGGVYTQGTFILVNGNITGNAAGAGGGGVQPAGKGTNNKTGVFIMYGGNITDNYSPSYGGGITSWAAKDLIIYGGTISNNTADIDGGGLFIEHTTSNIYNCLIKNNSANYGGGICIYQNGVLNLHGGTITQNKATQYGGGISPFGRDAGSSDNKFGKLNLNGTSAPIIVAGNIKVPSVGDIQRCDVYVSPLQLIEIPEGKILMEGSSIGVKPNQEMEDRGEIRFGNTTKYNNEQFFFADLDGDFEPFYDGDTDGLYLHSRVAGDENFGNITHNHADISNTNWHNWNSSINLVPHESGYYVLTSNITFNDEMLQASEMEPGVNGRIWNISGESIHICLNGYKLDLNNSRIRVASKLYINDCNEHGGIYHFTEDEDGMWNFTENVGEAIHTVSGGIITGNHKPIVVDEVDGELHEFGGAIRTVKGSVIMKGGTIVGNRAAAGGGIYIDSGFFDLENGSIIGNSAILGGGGVEIKRSGQFNMLGGEVAHNHVTSFQDREDSGKKGGGICLGVQNEDDAVSFTMTGGTVHNNTLSDVAGKGSGVFVDSHGDVSMSGDATVEKSNDFYINTLTTPIRIFGDETFTGSIKSLCGDQARVETQPIIVHIDDDAFSAGNIASNILDQFILSEKARKERGAKLFADSNQRDIYIEYDHYEDNYYVTINQDAGNATITLADKIADEDGRYKVPIGDEVQIVTNLGNREYVFCNYTVKEEISEQVIPTQNVSRNATHSIRNFTMPAADVIVNATFGLRGDADYDGDVCIVDAACVGVHIIRGDENKLIIPDTNGYFCANVNDVDGIDVYDLLEINRYLVGLIEYPGCPVMP